jgi:hypothetical protein
MKQRKTSISYLVVISLAAGAMMIGSTAIADDKDRDRYSDHRKDTRKEVRKDRYDNDRYRDYDRDHKRYKKHDSRPYVIHRGPSYKLPKKRVRVYRDIKIIRPYGHWYHGYGHVHVDDDAYKWLAFTAITLKILDNLNEQQQREHEAAQVRATTAPIGEKIIWRDGNTTGSVTATREGTSTRGRYCREFQQEVTIGGRTEQAYGTACRQADGSWEVIRTETPYAE